MKMKNAVKATLFSLAIGSVILPTTLSAAPGDNGKIFGVGAPLNIDDLPPGRAKSRLESLPPAAQQRALEWMQRFEIPQEDLDFLHFDNEGGVLYVDPQPVIEEADVQSSTAPTVENITATNAFTLHSKPQSNNTIYLDFDGHILTNTAWNGSTGTTTLYAKPFNIDSDPSLFSADELSRIHEIWHRVSEDYAPFDVDVTTEEPISFGPNVGRILITENYDAYGNAMPHPTAGGIAYIGVWGRSNYDYYSPALVYFNRLGSGNPVYVSEAASHEMGHNLGLSHDGRSDPYNESYYTGHGSGYISWAPIMGVGYYNELTQWSKGEYDYANNTQDDLAIIASKLTLRSDDHGESISTATPLLIDINGAINATNPETENGPTPSTDNKGIIENASDIDLFLLAIGDGAVELTVTPAWTAFTRTSKRGGNLDIQATLTDINGTVIANSDLLDDSYATISTTLPAGDYYLAITGMGNSTTPYSDYGSLGQYFISGTVTPTSPPTTAPIAPSNLTAQTQSDSQVLLSWSDNADNESGYRIDRKQGLSNWSEVATLPANSSQYSDSGLTGLTGSTTYTYRVRAFNIIGESLSNEAVATTYAQPQPPQAPSSVIAIDGTDGTATINWQDNSDNETQFEIEQESLHPKNGQWRNLQLVGSVGRDITSFIDNSGAGTFRYRVRAINALGSSTWSNWGEVTVTDSSSGGTNPKCHPKRGC